MSTRKKNKTKVQSVKTLVKKQLTALSETKMRNASSLVTDFSSITSEWTNIPLTNIVTRYGFLPTYRGKNPPKVYRI